MSRYQPDATGQIPYLPHYTYYDAIQYSQFSQPTASGTQGSTGASVTTGDGLSQYDHYDGTVNGFDQCNATDPFVVTSGVTNAQCELSISRVLGSQHDELIEFRHSVFEPPVASNDQGSLPEAVQDWSEGSGGNVQDDTLSSFTAPQSLWTYDELEKLLHRSMYGIQSELDLDQPAMSTATYPAANPNPMPLDFVPVLSNSSQQQAIGLSDHRYPLASVGSPSSQRTSSHGAPVIPARVTFACEACRSR